MKKLAGRALAKAIVGSGYLPDYPDPFRKQQVELALKQEGFYAARQTLDQQLFKLCQQGFLERSHNPDTDRGRLFYWYRFAHPSRVSKRPGFRVGEQEYLRLWNAKT